VPQPALPEVPEHGSPTPASHYTKRGAETTLAGANYVCTGCHAPQAGVRPLVDNRCRFFARYCAC
jgi:nitrate reductase cytochrome c-type subunit